MYASASRDGQFAPPWRRQTTATSAIFAEWRTDRTRPGRQI